MPDTANIFLNAISRLTFIFNKMTSYSKALTVPNNKIQEEVLEKYSKQQKRDCAMII
jgi:hypothetical protein